MEKHNCYNCVYREKLLGDAHSRCGYLDSLEEIPKNIVSLDTYGVSNGWANWPHNFDPLWVKKCKVYKKIETPEQK
jgi:hypothetical protein